MDWLWIWRSMKRFLLISIFLFSNISHSLPDYYNLPSPLTDLKNSLFSLLDSCHEPKEQSPDQILAKCNTKTSFTHKSIGYKKARESLFGHLFLVGTDHSSYSLM